MAKPEPTPVVVEEPKKEPEKAPVKEAAPAPAAAPAPKKPAPIKKAPPAKAPVKEEAKPSPAAAAKAAPAPAKPVINKPMAMQKVPVPPKWIEKVVEAPKTVKNPGFRQFEIAMPGHFEGSSSEKKSSKVVDV